jgi:hypothetical protein
MALRFRALALLAALSILLAVVAPAPAVATGSTVAVPRESSCRIVLTFLDNSVGTIGSFGGQNCCAYVGGNDHGYKGFVSSFKPDRTCPVQPVGPNAAGWVRFYKTPDCSGAFTAGRAPEYAPKSVWTCVDASLFPKVVTPSPRFVFRSLANKRCFTYNNAVTSLGFPRLLLATCSEADANR